MAPSSDFLEFLQDQLRGLGRIAVQRMFSGAGLYCDGVIFALILRDTLYFKVDDSNRRAYEAEGLRPFSYDAGGRTVSNRLLTRATARPCHGEEAQVDRPSGNVGQRGVVKAAREVHLEIRIERRERMAVGRGDVVRRLPAFVQP